MPTRSPARSGRVVLDSWYGDQLAPRLRSAATPAQAVLPRWSAPRSGWWSRIAARGPLRALALVLTTRPADTVVTSAGAPGARSLIALGGLLGRRNLVLLEYIVHPPTGSDAASLARRGLFVVLRRVLAARALLAAQVMTAAEVDSCARSHRLEPERFQLVPWPGRFDAAATLPDRVPGGRRVLCSGRRVDWTTFAAAARDADWQVTAICSAADAETVHALLAGTGADVLVEVDQDEHQARVRAASVYVVPLPVTGASIGQIRVMNAADAGTPLVVSRGHGIEDYVDAHSAVLVDPGDPVALRAAVDAVLDDPDRQAALRRALFERGAGYDMQDYLDRLATLLDGLVDARRTPARSPG